MLLKLVLFSGCAGITVFIGGILANFFNHHVDDAPVKYEVVHTLMAFGAGILLSAIALVLIPKSMETLDWPALSVAFLSGAVLFMLLDRYLSQKGGQTATLIAMLTDFIPESIALGSLFAVDAATAYLLSLFIGLQNLPEAFNSFRDLVQSGYTVTKTLTIFFFLSFFGIGGALIGHFFLADHPEVTGLMMTFASGGILYLLVRDLIPESYYKKSFLAPTGACLGFLVGIIGEKVI